MKFYLYVQLVVMRLKFYITLFSCKNIVFKGKCCCSKCNIKSIKGSNHNNIIFGKHVVLKNCNIYFEGKYHTLRFGDNIRLENVNFFFEKNNSHIFIGNNTWIGPQCELSAFDDSKIVVGQGCILAKQCVIRTSDSHIIRDEYGNIINRSKDITIGSHVWLGQQAFILKGATISDGCIVGAKSIVTSSLVSEVNSLIVGQPAKVIKKNVSWEL